MEMDSRASNGSGDDMDPMAMFTRWKVVRWKPWRRRRRCRRSMEMAVRAGRVQVLRAH